MTEDVIEAIAERWRTQRKVWLLLDWPWRFPKDAERLTDPIFVIGHA